MKFIKISTIISVMSIHLLVFSALNFTPLSPDENVFLFFVNKIKASDALSLSYSEPLNEKFDTNSIHPRSTVYSPITKRVGPNNFLGIYIIFGILGRLFPSSQSYFFIFLSMVITVLGITFFYYLTKELFGKNNAFISFALLAFYPPLFFWSFRPLSDIPAVSFLLGGILYLIRFFEKRANSYLLLASLFFGLAIIFRYPTITIVVTATIIFYAYSSKRGENRGSKNGWQILAGLLVFFYSLSLFYG